jgi:hypothetical protein
VPTAGDETAVSPAPNVSTEPTIPVEPERQTDPLSPQQVTENFYNWYLEAIGDRSDGSFTNPLVTGLYQQSDYLTANFVASIDEVVAGFDQGGFDPILQAQDIPERIDVQEPSLKDMTATVVVLRYWGGNPDPTPMTVHLIQENGRWLIDNVTALEIPTANQPAEPETADAVVRAFYSWYLGYFGDPAGDNFRNPLVDKAYRDTPYLTESFVQHIDELLQSFNGAGYDPFLCAQDIPTEMSPEVTFTRNGMAGVTMRSSFPNHMVVVDLQSEGDSWLISNVTCAHDPVSVATAFYTWYLGYIGDRSSSDFRNPLVDKAYHNHPLLTEAWIQTVDETLAGFENGGFDPFLMAQDIPQDFSVDPGVESGTAVVHLKFGSECSKDLLITMDDTGRKIAAIAEDASQLNEAPVHEGSSDSKSVYINDTFGFSFSYPAEWVLQEEEMNQPGMPDDWPVQAMWYLMPADVAEHLASLSGPPDPNAPDIVSPFNIEVVVGDKDALMRVYGDLDGDTAISGVEADFVLQRDPGYSHVIFAHPLHPDTWLIFTDWVTQFPGREVQGQAAEPVWQPLLNSLQFHK